MAEIKITRQEIISLCRLCLGKDLVSIDIFEAGSELRHLYTKIVACLPVQVFATDTLPHKICEVCNAKVDDFYQFWTCTAKNQKQLNDWLQIATDQITDAPTIKVEAEDTSKNDEFDDYDDGARGDDSEDEDEEASVPKRIKTQHSDDEDTKPTELISSMVDESSEISDQKEGNRKRSKEIQLFTKNQDENSSLMNKSKFKCDKCGKYFKTRRCCHKHTKRVHLNPNKSFECDICKDRFSTSNKLKKHVDSIHSLKDFFDDDSLLASRPKKNEPLDTGDYTLEQWNELVLSKTKECPVCHKTYANPKSMRKHLREVHSSQKKYVCDACGKQFTSTNRVTQHRNKFHLGINNILEKKFECDICNMKFQSKFFMSEHINTHTGHKPYHCSICNKSYANMRGYRRDLKRHKQLAGELKDEELHYCRICNKSFLEHNRLTKHIEWVHGDKCHVCKVCGRKIKGSIQKHMLSHTGEKPFCCHICGKSFKGNLKDHMLTHTGERPFKCDVCGSSFKDKWYLGVHKRKHSGEKPYECDFCGQFFAARSTFTAHLKKHDEKTSSVKSYNCQICKLRFENELHLSSHYSEHFAHNSG